MSYHDLHITTAAIKRTSIFDLPYGIEVTCTRVSGWQVHRRVSEFETEVLAGEFGGPGLRLDVAGHVIIDTLLR